MMEERIGRRLYGQTFQPKNKNSNMDGLRKRSAR